MKDEIRDAEDVFYNQENQENLKKVISDIENGKTQLEEHELIKA